MQRFLTPRAVQIQTVAHFSRGPPATECWDLLGDDVRSFSQSKGIMQISEYLPRSAANL